MEFPKWSLPARIYLTGGSGSGKTTFLAKLLDEQNYIFRFPDGQDKFSRTILAHSAPDPIFSAISSKHPQVELVEGLPKDFLKNPEDHVNQGDNILIILDDLII